MIMERRPRLTLPGLGTEAERFTPGHVLVIDNRGWLTRGTVICTDPVETWLECYLTAEDGADHAWLGVESSGGAVRHTLWRRAGSDVSQVPIPPDGDSVGLERGSADYVATGTFGEFEVPRSGVLDYVEFVDAEGTRTAYERFAPALPWLVGRCAGEVIVTDRP